MDRAEKQRQRPGERRAEGRQPLGEEQACSWSGSRAASPGEAEEGTVDTHAAQATGRTEKEPEGREGLTAGLHHPENQKLAVE